jgi:plastocyanin
MRRDTPRRRNPAVPLLAAVLGLAAADPAHAAGGGVEVLVRSGGQAVEGAVVSAVSKNSVARAGAPDEAVIDQKGKEFIPHVLAVRAGTKVQFPNSDNIRHHVYSFSPAKTFEIPLYKDTPAAPILFDRPGVVVLGCNIHDWMLTYVFVAETPHVAVTDPDGKAAVRDLPPGSYEITVWHPQLKGAPRPAAHRLTVGADTPAQLAFEVERKKVFRARPLAGARRGGY